MNIYSKFILILIILLSTTSVYASSNYDDYRKDIDYQIEKLGYTNLRQELSSKIHKLEEPWEISYFKDCLAKKVKALDANKVYNEDCNKWIKEPLINRFIRLELIVDSIVLELDNAKDKYNRNWFWTSRDLAHMILINIHNESQKFNLKVHQGIILGDNGHSFGLGQIWSRKGDPYFREEIVGYNENDLYWSLTQTRHNIFMSARHLTYHAYRCVAIEKQPKIKTRDYSKLKFNIYSIAKIFSGYGTGHSCSIQPLRVKIVNGKKQYDKNNILLYEINKEPLRRATAVFNLIK